MYDELRKAKVDFQMEFYSGAAHGFSVPKNKDEERANTQSIARRRGSSEVFGTEQAGESPQATTTAFASAHGQAEEAST